MTTDTTPAAIEALLTDVTPGPWEWGGYPDDLRLQTVYGGKVFVMTFARKGFRGAQPRFQQRCKGMIDADELLQFQVGDRDVVGEKAARENGSVYRYDVRGIDNPDARFIAAARDLVPALAAEAAALRGEVARLREAIAYVLDGHGLNAPDFKRQPEDDEDNWIVIHLRAALTAEPLGHGVTADDFGGEA